MEIARSTVGAELELLLGPAWKSLQPCAWAPDVFAICGWILEASGGYTHVLEAWPPGTSNIDAWTAELSEAAKSFRECSRLFLVNEDWSVPSFVETRWQTIVKGEGVFLDEIKDSPAVCDALIALVAVADEACVGFGLPRLGKNKTLSDPDMIFLEDLQLKLAEWTTLTPRFPTTRLCTLPKQHTPKFGITLRSISHHLALFTGGEVTAGWSIQPEPRGARLNLLVVPWPFEVVPRQFKEARCLKVKMTKGSRCFDYELGSSNFGNQPFKEWLRKIFEAAQESCGNVNGVIFPEASLSPEDFADLNEVALSFGSFVVCGVSSKDDDQCHSKNEVWMTFGQDESRADRKIKQAKHHRWQLNSTQIAMYGLGGALDPNFKWWEHIEVDSREVNFVALHGLLTMCCLVCEDLARQDPVARLVRAVGPNLVIALLSDGPQLSARWPARYATVLADDPGSSVLTVTNLGMTKLAEPPAGKSRSRAIALWKDAFGGLKEVILEPGASGVMLNLWTRVEAEESADGRSDEGVAAFPQLAGTHQIVI